ncbi:MAG: hypothetical protein JW936_06260 [Sedimentisphaerales bacterium]|nr:hypothetical protein [Sedimentisphaerales bacterium]
MTGLLKLLRDYFPTAIYTGTALVFISEESRVELTEHTRRGVSGEENVPIVRVRLFQKDDKGEFEPGHYEDFQLADLSDLAGEIEKFVQFAVGKNLKE